MVDYIEDGLACSFGFALNSDGEIKIVRIWRPRLIAGGQGQHREISSTFDGNGWTEPSESDTWRPFIPATGELARFVGGYLYWKGKRSGNVVLRYYNVETDNSNYLPPPEVEEGEKKYLNDLALGHGWAGELSAGLYAHPSADNPNGQMRLWSLRLGVWVPIRVLRPRTIPREMRPLVPLLFFQGRDDRLLKFVFVKDGDEIVVTSSTEPPGGGYRTNSLFAGHFSDPPPLLPSTIGSEAYTYAKTTNSMLKGNGRYREPEDEEQRKKKKNEAYRRSFEELDGIEA